MIMLVFLHVLKQHRSVTKDMANFFSLLCFDYYFNIIKMHSLTVFEVTGSLSFKTAVRVH